MKPSQMTARVTMWALFVVEATLGLRFVLRLFGADATNEFVRWVYENTAGVLEPIFENAPVRISDGIVLELSTLIAMAVYATLAYAILALVGNYRAKADGAVPSTGFSVSFRERK